MEEEITPNTDGDLEYAIRLQLHEQGITNETVVQQTLNRFRNIETPAPITTPATTPATTTSLGATPLVPTPTHFPSHYRSTWDDDIQQLGRYRDAVSFTTVRTRQHHDSLHRMFAPRSRRPQTDRRTVQTPLGPIEITYSTPQTQYPSQTLFGSLFGLTMENLMSQMFPTQEPTSTVATHEEISRIPVINLEQLKNLQKNHPDYDVPDDCVICQDEFTEDPTIPIRHTDCHHFFHQPCLDKWLEGYNNRCPVCRKECGKV